MNMIKINHVCATHNGGNSDMCMELENIPDSELPGICREEVINDAVSADTKKTTTVELHDKVPGHITSCHVEVIDDNELLVVGMKFST